MLKRPFSTSLVAAKLKFDLRKGLSRNQCREIVRQPGPIRARFAPSPTGFLHLGSLRTALFNYFAAKASGGKFILRIEDTDQTRLVPGAEQNIYDVFEWLGIKVDEGPNVGGRFGPYRQTERTKFYQKPLQQLLDTGYAYRCFCSKERLDQLRDSARLLKPPTTASYDRHCAHILKEESDRRAANGEPFTVRFKAPEKYPIIQDMLRGRVNQQVQVNPADVRYDDPVLMKSDGLPTYHFANVVDDHLMRITHVIRGEEWLASTPKHVALYEALDWKAPLFFHIPLVTTMDNRKLSKRSGDIGIRDLRARGYLPETLVNYTVLLGWSPRRSGGMKFSEVMSMADLESQFSLTGLTRGSVKMDFRKLDYFNREHLARRLADTDSQFYRDSSDSVYSRLVQALDTPVDRDEFDKVFRVAAPTLSNLVELDVVDKFGYFFVRPQYSAGTLKAKVGVDPETATKITAQLLEHSAELTPEKLTSVVVAIHDSLDVARKAVFQTLRYAVTGPHSGTDMHTMISIIGPEEVQQRLADFATFVQTCK